MILSWMRSHPKSPRGNARTAEPWVSIDEVAAHVGVGKDSIYRWIDGRGLPATKVGKLWKLKLSEVDAWMRARPAPDAAPRTPRKQRPARRPADPRRLVLVVDDDELVRDTVHDFLTDEGFDVAVAGDGGEAMSLLRSSARLPDLIVFDLKMPRLDGWQFRAQQLADPRLSALPVVVVSAVPDAAVAGALVVKKPLHLDALATAMAKLLAAPTREAPP